MRHIRAYALATALAVGLAGCAPRPGEAVAAEAHATAIPDDQHPGKVAYDQWCASCHDTPDQSGAPSLAAIRTLNRSTVKYALELGYMKQQAKNVPKEELAQLIEWIPSADSTNDAWVKTAGCPIKLRQVHLDGAARHSVTFGVSYDANRSQTRRTGRTEKGRHEGSGDRLGHGLPADADHALAARGDRRHDLHRGDGFRAGYTRSTPIRGA